MYIIRRAKVDDVPTLHKLAKMVHFINLPPDRDIITQKVVHSRNSFLNIADAKAEPEPEPEPTAPAGLQAAGSQIEGLGAASTHTDLFMFVLEDAETGNTIGTSQTLARMGGPGNPNFSFKLEKRHYYSESLQTGTTQTVALLEGDESGPTEIGGLILQPSFRKHPLRLGYFLSIIRFHFMGLHRERFSDRVLAEMMAPISSEDHSLLWDALGRRFVPLSYDEADRFCQYSREFIASLLPREPLFLSLLPPAARAVIGEVGPETRSARRMLERLGFVYEGFVDPFDGGPHLSAVTDEIPTVKETRRLTLGEPAKPAALDRRGIVSVLRPNGEFFAVHEALSIGADGTVRLHGDVLSRLGGTPGDVAGVTPTDRKGWPEMEPAGVMKGTAKKAPVKETGRKRSAAKKPAKKTAKKPGKSSGKKPATKRGSKAR